MEKKPRKTPSSRRKQLEAYGKYSAIAGQMIFIILAGVFGGIKLDEWLNLKFPVFTLILTLAGVGLALYSVIRQVTRND